jgi:hypothetical protein
MRFLEGLRSRWFDKTATEKEKEEATLAVFLFRGKTYILDDFDINFLQDTDDKHKPNSETYGGLISISTSEVVDEALTTWMMNLYETRDGEIRLIPEAGKLTAGASLIISFKDAYCVGYHKVMQQSGIGLQTKMTIAPRSVKIGNEEFETKRKMVLKY